MRLKGYTKRGTQQKRCPVAGKMNLTRKKPCLKGLENGWREEGQKRREERDSNDVFRVKPLHQKKKPTVKTIKRDGLRTARDD